MENNLEHTQVDTSEDRSPVFESWNTWYVLVVIVNIVVIVSIYFFFKSL